MLSNTSIYQTKRNYGIDLLKILAMINVINLHLNLATKYFIFKPDNPKYKPLYRLEAFSYWAVDAFGLISGIIGYKKYKIMNMLYLYFEYSFYSIIYSIYLYFNKRINYREFIFEFFPLGKRRNWYVNAYIFMYLFLPFITDSINIIDKFFYRKIIIYKIMLYSFYGIITKAYNMHLDFSFINNGYSSLWLLILYIIGGYIGKYSIIKNNHYYNLLYLFLYLISSFFTSEFVILCFKKYKFSHKLFMGYCSPTIIMQALSLIFFFSNLEIKNKYVIKILLFLNPLNFNVTLIHSRLFFYFTIPKMKDFFNLINRLSPKYIFFKIYGISIVIYFICAFVDYFRLLLFKKLNIRNLCHYIENKLF